MSDYLIGIFKLFLTFAIIVFLFRMIDCMWNITSLTKWNITSLIKRNIILTMYYMDIEVGPAGQCVFDVININTGIYDKLM